MDYVFTITPGGIVTFCGAVITIAGAIAVILKAVKAFKQPNEEQNARISDLEKWREKVDEKLLNDNGRLTTMQDGNRMIQRALLALLDHGLDGNNVEQMQRAKSDLQNYLIER